MLPEFEWDEDKAAINFITHGVAFPFAVAVFLDPDCVVFDSSRREDGEERLKAVGRVGRRLLSVVFTLRDGRRRIISARRANRPEERRYADSQV
ncbi:MAG TPA: BrnT family toxin [Beijerinckiaceae bacterium]|jgi:uncharacterized DUF497 family protein|nr:BrnT family toxin [Beijerinckiaceae bacterium]